MAYEPEEQATALSVTQCNSFKDDLNFQPARESIKEAEKENLIELILVPLDENDPCPSSSMDSVFFHNERFELIVDARGYSPKDIKCMVRGNTIDVNAEKEDSDGSFQRRLSLARTYSLPNQVAPEKGSCFLSSEGILFISVPWKF